MKKNIKQVLSILLLLIVVLITITGCGSEVTDAYLEEGTIEKEVEVVSDEDKGIVDGLMEVHFIDVGQADSILIKTPSGERMLIDAGNNGDSDLLTSYLNNQGIKTIDIAVGTHPHEDHIGSLDTVINNFDVKKVYMPKITHTTKTFEDVMLAIKNKNLRISTPIPGDTFNLGEAKFTILAPNNDKYSSLNDYSIVLKLEYGNTSFLFTGDAEIASEKEMINKKFDLNADVLKVSHHGSSSSTSDDFLDAVSPKYAVISSEQGNDYGHPHKEIVEKLNKKDITIYRTDKSGTIVVSSDKENITFSVDTESINENATDQVDNKDVVITSIDKIDEIVVIKNNSLESIDLVGWKLISVRGNQEYIFTSYILNPGDEVTITSGDVSGDLIWGKTNIWNNSESDPGELYDNLGNLIYTYMD